MNSFITWNSKVDLKKKLPKESKSSQPMPDDRRPVSKEKNDCL